MSKVSFNINYQKKLINIIYNNSNDNNNDSKSDNNIDIENNSNNDNQTEIDWQKDIYTR